MSNINTLELQDAVSENMIRYGLAVNARSLPNNIDGLKSTQRRILYALYSSSKRDQLRKSMAIVGDAMKYVDTGNSGIYGALINMGQKDRAIHPLIDSQGSFGTVIDSLSSFAAERYTKAKISKYAMDWYFPEDYKFVDWMKTHDGENEEPSVLPTLIPMALVMGSYGLGYTCANNSVPLGLKEVCAAYIEFLKYKKNLEVINDKKKKSILSKLEVVTPADGVIVNDYKYIFTHKRGTIKMKGRYKFEEGTHGRERIVITNLPYLAETPKFISKFETAEDEIKNMIAEISDESNMDDGIRIVITLKKTGNMEQFTKWLETSNKSPFLKNYIINYTYFSNDHKRNVDYDVLRLFEEHYMFKMNTLDKYFSAIVKDYTKRLTYAEAVLYIISDKKRLDKFFEILKKSSKEDFIINLKKEYKQFSDDVLEYIATRQFTVMLKNQEDINNQITDLRLKLQIANRNKENKIDYLIEEINTRLKKYK